MEIALSRTRIEKKRTSPQRIPATVPPKTASLKGSLLNALADAKKGEPVTKNRAPKTGIMITGRERSM